MNSAFNQTEANLRSRCAALVRLARSGALVALLACAGIGAAHAQRDSQRDDGQQRPRGERFHLPRDGDRADPRAYDPRFSDPRANDPRANDQRAFEEQQRREAQMQQDQLRHEQAREARRNSGRMTPDERRDLRRQINEAGMDLYQNPPRR